MLQAFGKPSHNHDGNEISYKAPLHHLWRFGCYASRLISELQRHGKFSARSKYCVMVGYVHDLTTLWRIWDPAFRVVRSQSDVIFDKERNAHSSCLHGDRTDIFELSEETEYVEKIETGGDGLVHDHAGTRRTGESHGSCDHDCTDDDTDHNLPEADNSRSLPGSTAVKSRPPDEEVAPPVSRETTFHNRHLRCENNNARRTAAMTKQSCQPPPRMNRIIRSQVKISPNVAIIMAKALALTSMNSDPFTDGEAMDSPQQNHWKRAMEEEYTSILLNNTFTTTNSHEARQLQVKPIGSKWVYKTKHNPDGTIQYQACLVIKGYKQTDFGETYASVGKLTTFRYLISLVGKHGWNINQLDVVTAFLNPEVDEDDIYMMLPKGWLEALNVLAIVVRLKTALYGLKQAR